MATFTVTTTADSGAGSLRAAVAQANATTGADTIVFAAGVQGGTIRLTTGQITITDLAGLTIDGGAGVTVTGDALDDDVTLAGGITDVAASGAALLDDNSRIFESTAGALTLDSLTLTGGRTTASSYAGDGGAVRAAGALTVTDSTIAGNSAAGSGVDGGGLRATGALTLTRVTVSGNVIEGIAARGGGVFGGAAVTLTDSVVTGNLAAGTGIGGGVFGVGTVTLNSSTIASNTAGGASGFGGSGGGVYGFGAVTLTNSTISGNTAQATFAQVSGGSGGGIFGRGQVSLTNSTVTGNRSGGREGDGGGVYGLGTVRLTDSLVLGNDGGTGADTLDDVRAVGALQLTGVNIISRDNVDAGEADVFSGATDVGDTTVAAVFAQTVGDVDPFGRLADNGGPVPTVALRADAANPAIDRSTATGADARGVAPVDFAGAGTGGAQRDLGAYEARQPETPSLVVTTAADVVDAFDNLTSLREAVAFANATAGAQTVSFSATVFNGEPGDVIRLTLGQIAITDDLTILGGGVAITGDARGNDVRAGGVTDVPATLAVDVGANGVDDDGDGATDEEDESLVSDNTRIFDIVEAGAVTLDGLVLTGGGASAGAVAADETDGGAVRSVRTALTITDSRIAGNVTGAAGAFGDGAGVAVIGGSLTLRDSVVSGNSTEPINGQGGGVYVGRGADLTVERSVISGNRAQSDGGGIAANAATRVLITETTVSDNWTNVNGGGLFLRLVGDAGIPGSGVLIENSTISGNVAARSGGGVNSLMPGLSDTGGFTPELVLVNTTVAENRAGFQGGAVYNDNGALTLRNSTVTGNAARADQVDGVDSDSFTRTTVISSIVVGNGDTDVGRGSTVDSVVSLGGNVIGTGNATGAFTSSGDLVGATAAQVFAAVNAATGGGALADNGGPVRTAALSETSVAEGRAVAGGPATDARGVARDTDPDSGAYEDPLPRETPSLVVTTEADIVDAFDNLTSLREAVAFANAQAGADTVSFAAGVSFIRLTQGQIAITDALTVDGGAGVTISGDAGADDATLPGGITDLAATTADRLDDNSRIFDAGAVAVTLDSLTLTGGWTTAASALGGAVRAGGDVTLIDVAVTGNGTAGFNAPGGGVWAAGALSLTRGAVSSNRTLGEFSFGGGLSAGGTATLIDSTVSGNSTAGARGLGGGVFAFRDVSLTNVTIHGNVTTGGDADGGGVATSNLGAVRLVNSTVTANRTEGAQAEGGGLRSGTNATTLTDSIVLGNVATAADGDEISAGSLGLTGGNIVGDGAGGADVFVGATDAGDATAAAVFAATIDNAGVVAGALGANGGPVATVALRIDGANPALDAATGGTVAADARGVAAVDVTGAGASGTGAAVRDLGAFELDSPQEARSLIVTTALDVVNPFDGLTSLREAVAFANATAGAQTVTFSATVFDGEPGDVIRLTQGEIAITDDLTILGGGVTITGDARGNDVRAGGVTDVPATLAVDVGANGVDDDGDGLTDEARESLVSDNTRIFNIVNAGAVSLDGLILTGGGASAGDIAADETDGGAVRSVGTALTIADSRIVGNVTGAAGYFGSGGGVAVVGGSLTLRDSVVSGNSTKPVNGNGGGIYAARGADLTVERSVISGNRAESDGGGIAASVATRVVISETTVSDNWTTGDGGGLFLRLVGDAGIPGSGAVIQNSTISGNVSNDDGGGIRSFLASVSASGGFTPATVVLNTTIADNRAGFDGGGVSNGNGAFELRSSTVTGNVGRADRTDGVESRGDSSTRTTVESSIIVGNGDSDVGSGATVNSFVSLGGNVVGIGNATGDFAAPGDLVGATAAQVFAAVNPATGGGELADNGGPVRTVALASGSVAIGRAVEGGPATDARGVARDADPDAGASEVPRPPEAPSLLVTTEADVVDAFDDLTSLREAVAFADASGGADMVTFADGVRFIRLTQGQITVADGAGLTIAGGSGVTISGDALDDDAVDARGVTDLDATAADRLDDNTRIFEATAGDLTLEGLTLTGGRTTGTGLDNADGGAVRAAGALTLTGVTLAGNETTGDGADGGAAFALGELTLLNVTVAGNRTSGENAEGGGVYGDGTVTVTNSVVTGNRTTGESSDGGGLFGFGAVTITDSIVSGNSTAGAFSFGGGVRGFEAVTLTRSTVSDNRTTGAGGNGGGVFGASVSATDSTVSGNATIGRSGFGGGVSAFETVTLTNVTVADNSTSGLYGAGGGVFSANAVFLISSTVTGNRTTGADAVGGGVFATEVATLTDSIVLGNVATQSAGDEVGVYSGAYFTGAVTPTGGTILGRDGGGGIADVFRDGVDVGDTTAAAVFDATVDNQGVAAGALADNGGPVRTVALRLAADNPALGLALLGGPAADARGVARDALPDAGAFEAENPAPIAINDAETTDEDASVSIDVLANDADVNGGLDPATVRIVSADAASGGLTKTVAGQGVWTVDPVTGAITFTPEDDYDSPVDAISYTVADRLGAVSGPAEVLVTITPLPDETITFQYLVAREITGIRTEHGRQSYRTAEFSGARNDVAFEDLVFDPRPDPARVGDVLVGGSNDIRFREFFAVLDSGGDPAALDAGDRLYRVSNAGFGDRLTSIPGTNQSQDVVNIRASGVVNGNSLGHLNGGVRFGDRGFGLDNGPDGESDARWLNRGDTLLFRLTGADSASDELDVVSFIVRTDRARADIGFDADRDGCLLRDANGARPGGFHEDSGDVFLRGLTNGAQVEVDFGEREVRVNGVASTANFRGLFDDPGRIGLGASLNGGRWALDDLTLGLA